MCYSLYMPYSDSEKKRAHNKKYRELHRDYYSEYRRAWTRLNPHKQKEYELVRSQVDRRQYFKVHKWCSRNLIKSGVCGNCRQKKYTEWSSKNRIYIEDPSQWQELCRVCHRQYDIEHQNVRYGVRPKVFV